jgi:hypothetical protein
MQDGMSGSPVLLEHDGNYPILTTQYEEVNEDRLVEPYLIGIHSDTFYSPEGESYDEARFGLNAAWYPILIRDILSEL